MDPMGKGNPHRYDSVVVGHNNLQIGEAVCFLLEEPRGGGVLKKSCKLFVDFVYNSLYQHHLRGANMTLTIHLAPLGCSRYIFNFCFWELDKLNIMTLGFIYLVPGVHGCKFEPTTSSQSVQFGLRTSCGDSTKSDFWPLPALPVIKWGHEAPINGRKSIGNWRYSRTYIGAEISKNGIHPPYKPSKVQTVANFWMGMCLMQSTHGVR